MARAIEKDGVDAALLDVGVEDAGAGVLEGEADGVLHKGRRDLLERCVGLLLVKHMNAVDGRDAREHQKGIICCARERGSLVKYT